MTNPSRRGFPHRRNRAGHAFRKSEAEVMSSPPCTILLNGTLFDPEIAHYLILRGTPDIDQNTKWKGKSSLLYATYSCK
jgi:hypothetical protein